MNSATTRVLSALALLPLLLALIWLSSPVVFKGALFVISVLALFELIRLISNVYAALALYFFYVPLPLMLIDKLRIEHGPGALMLLAGTVIASDSGQYYTGRAFGTRKLAPVISPKKKVEGAIGGLVIGSLVAVALGRVWPVGLTDIMMFATGFAMSVAGILGDLFESALKRRAGVKDSGNLIPGHGGILDRIDSLLFAAPVFWMILRMAR